MKPVPEVTAPAAGFKLGRRHAIWGQARPAKLAAGFPCFFATFHESLNQNLGLSDSKKFTRELSATKDLIESNPGALLPIQPFQR